MSSSRTARTGGATELGRALEASRRDTLATFEACERALANLSVPQKSTINPPLWELGHVGWFQEYWIARNPQRDRGARADPNAQRFPSLRSNADGLYDSSHVQHDDRWALPLPDAAATRADLRSQLDTTLALLRETEDRDEALYFFRLALHHEDMHHEAALYMAQSLGIAIDDARWQPLPLGEPTRQLKFDRSAFRLGAQRSGFTFDNELDAHDVEVPPTQIDSRVLRWDEFLPFVESGGYTQSRFWSDSGRKWLEERKPAMPQYLRRTSGIYEQWRHGRWMPLNPALPACHLTYFEAQAWCRWAGRRLPTEAEWERAAVERVEDFEWGQVWEWTDTLFAPYPGFTPHPYRDYSAPWFGSRQVLRGASYMTQPRMRHPCYRNFFMPNRSDVPVGFRTCAVPA